MHSDIHILFFVLISSILPQFGHVFQSILFNSDAHICVDHSFFLNCTFSSAVPSGIIISRISNPSTINQLSLLEKKNEHIAVLKSINRELAIQAFIKNSTILKKYLVNATKASVKFEIHRASKADEGVYICRVLASRKDTSVHLTRYMHLRVDETCKKESFTWFFLLVLTLGFIPPIIYCYKRNWYKRYSNTVKLMPIQNHFMDKPSHLHLPTTRLINDYVNTTKSSTIVTQISSKRTTSSSMDDSGFWTSSSASIRQSDDDSNTKRMGPVEEEFVKLYKITADPNFEIARQDVRLLSRLGGGAFGIVYSGAARNLPGHVDEVQVAVKTLKDNFIEADIFEFVKEMDTMKKLNHDHIIKLLAVCTQNGVPFIVMEYAPHGNLRDYLRTKKNDTSQSVSVLLDYGCQVAMGMDYLSSMTFVHRDLAARNILIGQKNVLKIADFGFTRSVDEYYRKITTGRVPVKWLAPESIFDRIYTTKSDVWSFGVLLWEVFTFGSTPFSGVQFSHIPNLVLSGLRNRQPSNAPDDVYAVMLQCWQLNSCERPTFRELVDLLEELKRRYVVE